MKTMIRLNANDPATVIMVATLPVHITNKHTAFRWLKHNGVELTAGGRKIVKRLLRTRHKGKTDVGFILKERSRIRKRATAIS